MIVLGYGDEILMGCLPTLRDGGLLGDKLFNLYGFGGYLFQLIVVTLASPAVGVAASRDPFLKAGVWP